jgi:hypothetical protein
MNLIQKEKFVWKFGGFSAILNVDDYKYEGAGIDGINESERVYKDP